MRHSDRHREAPDPAARKVAAVRPMELKIRSSCSGSLRPQRTRKSVPYLPVATLGYEHFRMSLENVMQQRGARALRADHQEVWKRHIERAPEASRASDERSAQPPASGQGWCILWI